MPKHHSEDYKLSAVKHYLEKTNNLTATCKEFDCSRISLGRWGATNIYKIALNLICKKNVQTIYVEAKNQVC
jgi:hypothetical protein